jgi:mitotic spindle assembly checkpoint protein MAD2B
MMDADLDMHAVVDTFTDFLIVAIHQILRERNLYSSTTFITAKEYNLPVHQNRHPDVCDYINRVTTAIHQAILSGTVKRVFVVIFAQDLPRERFVFNITQMFQRRLNAMGKKVDVDGTFPCVDAEEQLRAVLSKLRDHCHLLEPSNDQRTFRIMVEMDEVSALSPDDKQQWENIPNTRTGDDCCTGGHAANMVQIRSVKAGRLVFELWYEPAQALAEPSTSTPGQPMASDESISSSPSDVYGTFPSTQMGLGD